MATAAATIQKWAIENGYDSIVGIRFTATSIVYPTGALDFMHFAYGTCLRH
jgi:hypothetical protein